MSATSKKKFNWRSFVSLYMAFSGLIIAVSGVILYIAPAGRIAKWSHISILGLEKDQWQSLHTIFTFILVIAAGFHIYYNWRPFISYLRTRFQQKITLRKEMWLSTVMTVFIFGLVLVNAPPFSSVMDFGEFIKDGWATEQNEPPVPHAEEMTIAKLADAVKQPVDKLIANLTSNGIQASAEEVVKDLAEKYKMTPMELFKRMQLKTSGQTEETKTYQGMGYGRMSFEDVCHKLGIAPEDALQRLQEAGIMAEKNGNLKALASEYDRLPIDLINIMKGEKTE